MSDENTSAAASDDAKATLLTPIAGFEALALLSIRLSTTLAHAKPLTSRDLTPEHFVHLVAMANGVTTPVGKIARRTAAAPGMHAARVALEKRGLAVSVEAEGQAGRRFSLTDEGRDVLAAVEADLEPILAEIPARAWRSVPFVTTVDRVVGKALLPDPKTVREERMAKAAAGKKASRGKAVAAVAGGA